MSCLYTTTYWSSSFNLCFHSIYTRHRSVLNSIPSFILFNSRTNVLALRSARDRGNTIHTILYITATEFIRIFCNILLTSNFRDTFLLGEFIHTNRITSITWAPCVTVNKNLRRKSYLRPRVVPHDINSISKRRSSCLGPTRSTILWNMLIYSPAQKIDSIYISPIPVLG